MAEFSTTTTRTINCPDCASDRVVKVGTQSGEQRYLCRACKKKFRASGKAEGRRMTPEQTGAAVRMFYAGMSYKQIAESVRDMWDIPEPSKRTIYEWVQEYTQVALKGMKEHKAHTGGHWVADEMQLKVGGEKYWNWNVMDESTRYLLASHLTKERNAAAARAVMRKAREAADSPPETIKTDRLRSYQSAVKEVFPDAKHIQSDGIRSKDNNNNLSERVQGTFRQRTKTMRGLDSKESGQRYLDGWVLNYNLFREHESLDYKTPGEVAEVNPPYTEWADVARGTANPKVNPRLSQPGPARTDRPSLPVLT